MKNLFLNGRFLVQSLSGVQRFAREVTDALAAIVPENDPLRPVILLPPDSHETGPLTGPGLKRKKVGKWRGQIWEQFSLSVAARKGILLNLGNTGPVFGGKRFVVMHDAGVFAIKDSYSFAFRWWYRLLFLLLSRSGTKLITVSNFSQRELAKYLHIPAQRISVIQEGADHILKVQADESILQKHSLETGRFILAVGNLAPHKNLKILNSLSSVLEKSNLKLVISGSFNNAVFNTKSELPSFATFVGRVNDAELHALYRHAAVLIFPSIYEGFGLPPVEAMTCGCPVIATDIPVLREVCGNAALFFKNEVELKDAVLHLSQDNNLRETLKKHAFAQSKNYRWKNTAQQILEIIKDK
ncbi:glycosyltransferase family 4 protein [Kozakia baliensis]|uniref:glycosyltransferase family 4 protein n=1 Tax=Kozakia baliensis TaxID=153496 RepID=UPI00089DC969|nr:glycosyltransferase family 1 protein [Kozakia baliensis]GBR24737.1 glycosyltransferase [Kozakia baliensis NRIC 0488]GEL65229.1 mannosyltransferase [Kozakia baliensis]